MKPVFNSLGVNYRYQFRQLALEQLITPDVRALSRLKALLEKQFSGRVILTYKGRHALTAALFALEVNEGDLVFTQAFTCHAIESAIKQSGAKPVFVDLAQGQLNLGLSELNRAFEKYGKPKVLIVQHTLGFPAPITEISAWCKAHNVLLIEDLAQGVGASYANQPLGSLADALIFSFGRDKILDAVSGGACLIKNNDQFVQRLTEFESGLKAVSKRDLINDLLYPHLTFAIRVTHQIFLGKLIYRFLRLTGSLKSPVWTRTNKPQSLPPALARLAEDTLDNLSENLEHRKKIAQVYLCSLPINTFVNKSEKALANYLRFPILVDDPERIITRLKRAKIFLADRWYRSPVDSGVLGYQSDYLLGACPRAEEMSKRILNLPTHREINDETARKIATIITKELEK